MIKRKTLNPSLIPEIDVSDIYLQEQELTRVKASAEESERKYEEIMRRVQVLEADLEKAEENAEDYQAKYTRVENENTQLITSMFSDLD